MFKAFRLFCLFPIEYIISRSYKSLLAAVPALLAMAGKKTVIIDLDLRKPKIHLAFEQNENSIGVSSILIGKAKIEDCVQHSTIKNLDYI